jgi:hypothetical protein
MYLILFMEHRLKKNLKSLSLLRIMPLFPLFLGKTWIEKDQIRRKAEEESTKKKI